MAVYRAALLLFAHRSSNSPALGAYPRTGQTIRQSPEGGIGMALKCYKGRDWDSGVRSQNLDRAP